MYMYVGIFSINAITYWNHIALKLHMVYLNKNFLWTSELNHNKYICMLKLNNFAK